MKNLKTTTSPTNATVHVVDATNTTEIISVNTGPEIGTDIQQIVEDVGAGNWFGAAVVTLLLARKLIPKKKAQ